MHEGYCVKCKAKKPIGEATEETMKNGRKAVKGKCQTCGAVMVKILGGKVPPAPDASKLEIPSSTAPSPAASSGVASATAAPTAPLSPV